MYHIEYIVFIPFVFRLRSYMYGLIKKKKKTIINFLRYNVKYLKFEQSKKNIFILLELEKYK